MGTTEQELPDLPCCSRLANHNEIYSFRVPWQALKNLVIYWLRPLPTVSRAFTLSQDLRYDRRFTVHCSRFCGACLQLQCCISQSYANTAGLAQRSQGCVAKKRQAQDLPLMTSRTFSTLQSQPPKPLASSTWVLKYLMTAVMFFVNSPKTGSPCIATQVSADRYSNAYIVLPQQSQCPQRRACSI